MAKLKFESEFQMGFDFNQIPEYEVKTENGKIYKQLPYAFVDGNTLVKIGISLHTNCSSYYNVIEDLDEIPHEHKFFEGCLLYEKGEIRFEKGIYHTPTTPLLSISDMAEGIINNPKEMKEFVLKLINAIGKPRIINKKLLIKYTHYSVKIYDNFEKGRMLKFPVIGEQGHLKVVLVPRPHRFFDYQITRKISVEDHEIHFDKDITRFLIEAYGGDAELIYNHNDSNVNVEVRSIHFEPVKLALEPKRVYLIVHPNDDELNEKENEEENEKEAEE